jgi:hypothetical protein
VKVPTLPGMGPPPKFWPGVGRAEGPFRGLRSGPFLGWARLTST